MEIKKHLPVISNFSNFSPGIVFTNDVITVKNDHGSIIAQYKWGETLDVPHIGIYNVKEFIQVLSLFDAPELSFDKMGDNDNYIININQAGVRSAKYLTTEPEYIITDNARHGNPENAKLTLINKKIDESKYGEKLLSFKMTKEIQKEIKTSMRVVSAPHITFSVNDGAINITMSDLTNTSCIPYTITIKDVQGSFADNVTIYSDHFIIMDDTYEVTFFENGIIKFENEEHNLIYYILKVSN